MYCTVGIVEKRKTGWRRVQGGAKESQAGSLGFYFLWCIGPKCSRSGGITAFSWQFLLQIKTSKPSISTVKHRKQQGCSHSKVSTDAPTKEDNRVLKEWFSIFAPNVVGGVCCILNCRTEQGLLFPNLRFYNLSSKLGQLSL